MKSAKGNTYNDYLGINQEIKKNMFFKKEQTTLDQSAQNKNTLAMLSKQEHEILDKLSDLKIELSDMKDDEDLNAKNALAMLVKQENKILDKLSDLKDDEDLNEDYFDK